ncbi:MAG: DUF1150 family protein [Alphaproteobacteria bacterium]
MNSSTPHGFADDDLANYGMRHLVYIKPFRVATKLYHALHAADGTQLIIVEEREMAEATIRLHELEPVSVH